MSNRGKKPMDLHHIRFPANLWQAAKEKAGEMPLAVIIRRLLERWVKGEIDLGK